MSRSVHAETVPNHKKAIRSVNANRKERKRQQGPYAPPESYGRLCARPASWPRAALPSDRRISRTASNKFVAIMSGAD